MAEFDCFVTRDEFLHILFNAVEKGCVIQINKNLSAPRPDVRRTAQEVSSAFDEGNRSFILEHPEIHRYPIALNPFNKRGILMWYPRSRVGGPAIDAYYWAPFERDGQRFVPCSLFTYHSTIINPNNDQFEPAGDAIKSAFRLLLAPLKKVSRQVKSQKRSAMVSPGVDAMLASGWSLASPFTGK